MTDPIHLDEDDYAKLFPDNPDEFPTIIDDLHFIDAWLFNTIFSSLIETEQYLIDHRDQIEAALGDDIIGIEGALLISIPPANYPAYKSAMAWDSNLLAENILSGETIFGVAGSLEAGAGGLATTPPTLDIIELSITDGSPPGLTLDSAVVSIAVPAVTSP